MSKTNPCPKWAEKFISARSLYVVEESVVDPKAKTLTTYTRNISCKNYMTIDEKVVYKESKEELGWTIAERTAWIASSYGYGLSRAVEAFGLDRFKKNVKKANNGFQIVLDALYGNLKEGTDHDSILTSNLFHPWLKARVLREKAAQFQAAAKVSPIMTAAAMSSEAWGPETFQEHIVYETNDVYIWYHDLYSLSVYKSIWNNRRKEGREVLVFAGKKLALLKKFVIQAEPESCL